MNAPAQSIDRVWDQIGHDLGWNDHNMRTDRPYSGQPHTSAGARGAQPIYGVTFRDLRDCFIRAYILSHVHYKKNAVLRDEANKGQAAVICENDVYQLVGSIDPIAVVQNLCCEVEKLMGIYPNVEGLRIVP